MHRALNDLIQIRGLLVRQVREAEMAGEGLSQGQIKRFLDAEKVVFDSWFTRRGLN